MIPFFCASAVSAHSRAPPGVLSCLRPLPRPRCYSPHPKAFAVWLRSPRGLSPWSMAFPEVHRLCSGPYLCKQALSQRITTVSCGHTSRSKYPVVQELKPLDVKSYLPNYKNPPHCTIKTTNHQVEKQAGPQESTLSPLPRAPVPPGLFSSPTLDSFFLLFLKVSREYTKCPSL